MRRALSALLSREHRREVYQRIVTAADLPLSPRAGWLLLRVGEHRGHSRAALARHLGIGLDNFDARLFAAGQDQVGRLLDGWRADQHARLLELLTEITHELAASAERPGPDLEIAGPPRSGPTRP